MATEITTDKPLCPACGKNGKRVGLTTLQALLKDKFKGELRSGGGACRDSARADGAGCKSLPDGTGFRFCESPTCDVVYFAEEGDATFTKPQLRVPVGAKEIVGDRPLCYCFGYSVASIKEELRVKGRSDAVDDILAKMRNAGCRCETENPSGSCCLGSVAKGIKIAGEELMSELNDLPKSPADMKGTKAPRPLGGAMVNIGAVATALMASSCCWLPLVLMALGSSGVEMATALEVYRPFFIPATLGFLATAFYLTYRPKRMAGTQHRCCAAEANRASAAYCDATQLKARSSTIMSFHKVMLWGVTLFALASMFLPHSLESLPGALAPCCVHDNGEGNEMSACCVEAAE